MACLDETFQKPFWNVSSGHLWSDSGRFLERFVLSGEVPACLLYHWNLNQDFSDSREQYWEHSIISESFNFCAVCHHQEKWNIVVCVQLFFYDWDESCAGHWVFKITYWICIFNRFSAIILYTGAHDKSGYIDRMLWKITAYNQKGMLNSILVKFKMLGSFETYNCFYVSSSRNGWNRNGWNKITLLTKMISIFTSFVNLCS